MLDGMEGLEPRVERCEQAVRTREMRVVYQGEAVTLHMLRDFVYRSRNQHKIPNWHPNTSVSIEEAGSPTEGAQVIFLLTETSEERTSG